MIKLGGGDLPKIDNFDWVKKRTALDCGMLQSNTINASNTLLIRKYLSFVCKDLRMILFIRADTAILTT